MIIVLFIRDSATRIGEAKDSSLSWRHPRLLYSLVARIDIWWSPAASTWDKDALCDDEPKRVT